MGTKEDTLKEVYAAFNVRDVETVLKRMHPDVDWPNGMEGGRVLGHEGVRAYWARQWKMLDPHVEPTKFEVDGAGRTVLQVHQVVKDLTGTVLKDEMVQHAYTIEDGLILRMDIEKPGEK